MFNSLDLLLPTVSNCKMWRGDIRGLILPRRLQRWFETSLKPMKKTSCRGQCRTRTDANRINIVPTSNNLRHIWELTQTIQKHQLQNKFEDPWLQLKCQTSGISQNISQLVKPMGPIQPCHPFTKIFIWAFWLVDGDYSLRASQFCNPVNGHNPAPPGMVKTLQIMG